MQFLSLQINVLNEGMKELKELKQFSIFERTKIFFQKVCDFLEKNLHDFELFFVFNKLLCFGGIQSKAFVNLNVKRWIGICSFSLTQDSCSGFYDLHQQIVIFSCVHDVSQLLKAWADIGHELLLEQLDCLKDRLDCLN